MTATEEGLAKKFDDFIVNLEYYTKAEFAGVSGSVASGSTAVAEQVSDMATATSAAECLSYLDPSTWSHAVLTSTPKQLKQLLTVAGVSTSSRRSSRGGRRRGPAGQELLRGRLALHEAGAGKDVCVTVTKKDLDAGIVCGLPPPERLRANLTLVVSIPQRCHALLTSSRLHRRPHASSGALHGAACRRCFSCARVCFHLQSPFSTLCAVNAKRVHAHFAAVCDAVRASKEASKSDNILRASPPNTPRAHLDADGQLATMRWRDRCNLRS